MSEETIKRTGRFLISGAIAAGTNLLTLEGLVRYVGVWYLYASIIAYLLSFGVSFILQKFWTFEDHSRDNIHSQAIIYFIILLCGLAVNTFLVFSFVEYLHFHHLAAQITSGLIIAVGNYFAYHHLVFSAPTTA